jgi:hypothetical protein
MSPRLLATLLPIARDQRNYRCLAVCRYRGVRPFSAYAILTRTDTRSDYRRLAVQDWRNL